MEDEDFIGPCPKCDNGFVYIADNFAGIVILECTNINCNYSETKQSEDLDND